MDYRKRLGTSYYLYELEPGNLHFQGKGDE